MRNFAKARFRRFAIFHLLTRSSTPSPLAVAVYNLGNRLCDNHEWPRSPRAFTPQQIQIWQESLHKAFGGSVRQSKEIKQEFYLGTWYEDVKDTWTTHVDPVTMRLYKKFNSGWKEFPAVSFRTRRKKYRFKKEKDAC